MWSRVGRMAWVLIVVLAAACGGDNDGNPGELYPDRGNQYREDQERRIGESAMLGGYTATVTEAALDDTGSINVTVEITNRDSEPQRVDGRQWTLVIPRGQVLEVQGSSTLPTVELAEGETVTGTVSFIDDPGEVGDYYIQFKPKNLDAARGIWQMTIP